MAVLSGINKLIAYAGLLVKLQFGIFFFKGFFIYIYLKLNLMNFSAKMLRDNALSDKVIVVTGGGSGLGKAMTKYFLELGAKVAISSRDLEKLKTTAAELEKETGGKCLSIQCDVRHYDQVEALAESLSVGEMKFPAALLSNTSTLPKVFNTSASIASTWS